MLGLSRSRREIRRIEASLSRLENDPAASVDETLRVLEDLRRIEINWHRPAAAPTRWLRWLTGRSTAWSAAADLQELHRCYRRWAAAAQRIDDPQVAEARRQLAREFRGV